MKTFRHSAALATAIAFAAGMAQAETTLNLLLDGNADTIAMMEALTAAYTAANPDVTFEMENRPGGSEGDNMVKTRLATGEAGDIIQYNSGSLFQALRPADARPRRSPTSPACPARPTSSTASSRSSPPLTALSEACRSVRQWVAGSTTTASFTKSLA